MPPDSTTESTMTDSTTHDMPEIKLLEAIIESHETLLYLPVIYYLSNLYWLKMLA